MTAFDLMEGPNERRSFDSKAADVQSVCGGGNERRRDQRGRPQEEKTDFLQSDGEGGIESRGNVLGGGL